MSAMTRDHGDGGQLKPSPKITCFLAHALSRCTISQLIFALKCPTL